LKITKRKFKTLIGEYFSLVAKKLCWDPQVKGSN